MCRVSMICGSVYILCKVSCSLNNIPELVTERIYTVKKHFLGEYPQTPLAVPLQLPS